MSTNNSTGDKLVASVRKTKNAASPGAKTTRKKVAKKTARVVKKKVAPKRNSHLVDLYQTGKRVWPD